MAQFQEWGNDKMNQLFEMEIDIDINIDAPEIDFDFDLDDAKDWIMDFIPEFEDVRHEIKQWLKEKMHKLHKRHRRHGRRGRRDHRGRPDRRHPEGRKVNWLDWKNKDDDEWGQEWTKEWEWEPKDWSKEWEWQPKEFHWDEFKEDFLERMRPTFE